MENIDAPVNLYNIKTKKERLGKVKIKDVSMTLISGVSWLYLSNKPPVKKQRQGTRETIWALKTGFRNSRINSRRIPMMIIAGLFRSQ